jgi:hypothetical protein
MRKASLEGMMSQSAKFALTEAFDYFVVPSGAGELTEGAFNNERCVRAVAYLLHYCSENGNRDLDGSSAQGLGLVLEQCARRIALAEARREWLREHAQEERQGQ